eukprot:CAMPEP_0168308732 /NCGR_PEP_ID=MMETSP0142_2-20121227/64393_1 /TAXON_ID=44445 /ORGANISM="Pseudo-nitzschia australis, Strain 10249 10 AB" /LENGTH=57 /DNA_ID=CAMNT_0008261307 /DNA_START=121 /DNA_END=291 /DNA_ORIENTATION=-
MCHSKILFNAKIPRSQDRFSKNVLGALSNPSEIGGKVSPGNAPTKFVPSTSHEGESN